MNVLVFNCGSSSLKYRLIEMPAEAELAAGEAQRIGPPTSKPSRIVHRQDGRESLHETPMRNHSSAFAEVMKLLSRDARFLPDAIGHRFVHGGTDFSGHAIIDSTVLSHIDEVADLAPIHNPPAIALIRACSEQYPQLPQVAVFDTAYHSTIPDYARTYAIPQDLTEKLGLRKYGFHGTSHQFVASETAKFLNKPLRRLNAVSCHLGSGGASLCAIVGGQSVDNTMGYSPLQGLLMSTRCGDLDPAVTLRMLYASSGDANSVEKTLNHRSGVLGLTGTSADIRDALAVEGTLGLESPRNTAATQVYLWRLRKYLGAYLAVVGAADAVIFTDTIGETVPYVRWAVCSDMETFGLRIDPSRNDAATALPADVADPQSPVRILVIATNEELAIARHTFGLLSDVVAAL
jgi:acetate kinase